jgi:hypothetical protein
MGYLWPILHRSESRRDVFDGPNRWRVLVTLPHQYLHQLTKTNKTIPLGQRIRLAKIPEDPKLHLRLAELPLLAILRCVRCNVRGSASHGARSAAQSGLRYQELVYGAAEYIAWDYLHGGQCMGC